MWLYDFIILLYVSEYIYMSSYNNLSRHTRSQHVQIMSKTQIALEAIRKYEARHNRMFEKNKQYLNNPYAIFKEIDDHYTRVNYHKELKLDKISRVQILPLNEEYYYISTQQVLFPVRIFLRNVRNQGVLYVGYDREFPGVDRIEEYSSRKDKVYQSQKKLYDCKFTFNKDIMCVLKNQKKKPIHKIYLTIVAKKQLLLLNMKFDYVGYEGMDQKPVNRTKRALTEGNLQLPPTSPVKKNFETLYESDLLNVNKKRTIGEDLLKRSKTQVEGSPFLNKATEDSSPGNQQKREKNFIKQNLNSMLTHKRQNSKQLVQLKRQKTLQSMERIKANKQQLQEFKQKQRQIKQAAAKLKKAIQHYQKIYKQERIRDRKVLNLLAPFIYMNIFALKSNKTYNKQTQSIARAFKVRYIIKKFSKALRKKYIANILQIGNFKVRNQMSCFHMFQLASKLVYPMQTSKSAELIFKTFTSLEPGLILNHSLNQSSIYRQRCRTIQRRWILKYRARMYMLQNFAVRHMESMFKEYPHLRLALNTWKTGNYCHKICYEYTIDQSAKFRHIYDAYRKRVMEIDDFVIANEKIKQFNKGKPENKKKALLEIPKKPNPPQHRIFRNLDILKSMVRGWFEIQYKKILKKNTSGK